eukprot:GDKH01023090.1.p2 GENE.GDKH01023090.1~~GDKH01023090.1.p2  ORF type:complete len:62 (-),score=3.94 GDKH01023090.1:1126-1311(-)
MLVIILILQLVNKLGVNKIIAAPELNEINNRISDPIKIKKVINEEEANKELIVIILSKICH